MWSSFLLSRGAPGVQLSTDGSFPKRGRTIEERLISSANKSASQLV